MKKTKAVRRRLQAERKRTPAAKAEHSVEAEVAEAQDFSFDPVEPFDSSPVLPFEVEQM